MTRADVLQRLAELRPWLAAQGIVRLQLFGSFARNEARSESDIDLVATLARPFSLLELLRLEQDLARELGRAVDLATEQGLKPRARARIAAEAVDA